MNIVSNPSYRNVLFLYCVSQYGVGIQKAKAYLLGRTHNRAIKVTAKLKAILKITDAIVVESISEKGTDINTFLKDPLLYIIVELYSFGLRLSSKSKKVSADVESFSELLKLVIGKDYKKLIKYYDSSYNELINRFYRAWHYAIQIILFLLFMLLFYTDWLILFVILHISNTLLFFITMTSSRD